jgi:uncharacterized protein YjiS (DUF1127 family)
MTFRTMILDRVHVAIARAHTRARIARDTAYLAEQSDRVLADIGLRRDELRRVVRDRRF